MPRRLTIICLLPLVLSKTAFAQQQTAPSTSPEYSLWDHNRSVMYLVAEGESREFYYQQPRPGMLEAGAHPDSLVFSGQISNGQLSGTAYLFNPRCGQAPFQVKGFGNDQRVVLTGQAPRAGRNCRTHGYFTVTLEFKLLQKSEVVQSEQPASTAKTLVEEPITDAPSASVGEPSTPSAQPPVTAQASPVIAVPKADQPVGVSQGLNTEAAEPTTIGQIPLMLTALQGHKPLSAAFFVVATLLFGFSIWLLIRTFRRTTARKRRFGLMRRAL
jgi:hypothetical protein